MEGQLEKIEKAQQAVLAFPSSKRDVNRIAGGLIHEVFSGNLNPLEVEMKLRFLEELVKVIRGNEKIKDLVLEEAEKYPEKTFTMYGGEITKTSLGTRYDYSECEDSYYNDILKEIAELNDARKEREKLLQNLRDDMVVEETGEIIHPPVRTGKEGLRIKLL